MRESFQKLAKILKQEQKLGYENRAVIGGLERLAGQWMQDALEEAQTKEERLLVEKIVILLRRYHSLEQAGARQGAIEEILEDMRDMPQEPEPSQEQEPREEKEPPSASPPPSPPQQRKDEQQPPAARSREQQGEEAKSASLMAAGLNSSVTRLPGIKQGYANRLARLGVETIGDLLTLYPRRYDDYRSLKTINQLEYGEEVTIIGHVWAIGKRQTRSGKTLVSATITDGTGAIEATWFNQPWLLKSIKQNSQLVLSGRVSEYLGRLVFTSPEWEMLDKELVHTGRLVPVYPLTEGISQKWMRNLMKRTVDYWTHRLPDCLPREMLKRLGFLPFNKALAQIHYPDDRESLEQARRRLAFDELLTIQLTVLRQRHIWQQREGRGVPVDEGLLGAFVESLPFGLTGAQNRVLEEILGDIRRDVPMNRLLQGDVGSGKTVVAMAAMLMAVAAGSQAAIMAPTEILAEQHYQSITNMLKDAATRTGQDGARSFFEGLEAGVRLLTGSTPNAEKEIIYRELEEGSINILVGTHALIQSTVRFKNLSLTIVDEQHRFGVRQRAILREKGYISNTGSNPHMLVMSATPIPRTLALTLYGDLDLSVIDEMPPGRQEIETRWLSPLERERAYAFVRQQVELGRQAFIICPLVEESESIEAKSAIEEHKRLQEKIFPDLKLGLLHGRMRAGEKEDVMRAFRSGKMNIMVSTSVVEVGIDIPNATIMLVEGANRFGLAQLHQFRGRVGRGPHKSYCLLLADTSTPEAEARLGIMERTNDGFILAEEDLKLRGPGEFFGTRQSGLPDIKLARLSDRSLLDTAREEAMQIYNEDPTLENPQYRLLAQKLEDFWKREIADLRSHQREETAEAN